MLTTSALRDYEYSVYQRVDFNFYNLISNCHAIRISY